MRSDFYNNYLTEETLVKKANCGGYLEQPICLYDFTVKTMSHDCLNFSTRHMAENGKHKYIDTDYIKVPYKIVNPYERKNSKNKLSQTSRSKKNQRVMGGGKVDRNTARNLD